VNARGGHGIGGRDTFNVYVRPTSASAGGRLLADGGSPSGGSRGDRLQVFYVPYPVIQNAPSPTHPGVGAVDLTYADVLFPLL
jgi:hypothetical protein